MNKKRPAADFYEWNPSQTHSQNPTTQEICDDQNGLPGCYTTRSYDDATYVADLEFAARIGKILLEQNKELEDHSKLLQEKIADQDAKILHLEKQLNVLRDLEDYRCKVYDQLQTSCQEFETENQQLIRRHHLATEQIKRLKILSDEQELQE